MKLSHRFNFLVIPLVVLPLLSLGHITYMKVFEESRAKTYSAIDNVLAQLTQRLDQAIGSARTTSDLLAADLVMEQYAQVDDDADRYALYQRGLLNRFRVYMDLDPRFLEVRYILPDGYEDARWSRPGLPNVSDEVTADWWFESLLASRAAYSQFAVTNPDTGERAVYVFKPLYSRNTAALGVAAPRTLRGYISVTLDLAWLQAELNQLAGDNKLYISLLSPRGQPLLSSGNVPLSGDVAWLKQFAAADVAFGVEGKEGVEIAGSSYYVDADLSLHGYRIVSAAPMAQIRERGLELSLEIVLLTIASIAITIIVVSFFLRRVIIRPLRRLIDASNTIGSGKLGTHIVVKGDGELRELAESFNRMARDLTRSDEQIRYIAHHDTLTELPNRYLFQLYLNKSIASARRTQTELALLFLDIDHFKTVNDTLGHDVGDKLLRQFSHRISTCLREEDFLGISEGETADDLLARHGGDEFTIILPRIDGAWSASVVAQRIIDSLKEEIVIDGHALRITTSIGVTMYPRDGRSLDALLKCADIAMYHAKEQGRNNYQFYTAEMMEKIVDRIEGEKELRQAIEQGEMTLHYQPQIHTDSEQIYGLEALVRWEHSERGMISPFRFIHLAEETGLIVELGAWVLKESCQQAARWLAQGFGDFRLSVNVSSVQFNEQDISILIAQTLAESGLPGENLTIELTESILMSADNNTWEQLRKIQDLGVSIALDDFGTGYSSLSYLRTFPVDILKIDRSFIAESHEKEEIRAIVAAIVEMAKALNLQVVAEGVEQEAHVKLLKDIRCDVIQGYYYARPMPVGEATEYLQHRQDRESPTLSVAAGSHG